MKKLMISNKCAACGACFENTMLIEEKLDGTASAKGSGIVTEEQLEVAQRLIKLCPLKAISIVDGGLVKKSGKEGLKELKNLILREYGNFKVPFPDKSKYEFVKKDYSILIPTSSSERKYEYKSSSKAEDAGKWELDRLMYSQCKALVQQLMVQYKNRKLTQFMDYRKEPGNYYYDIISSFQKRFAEFVAEAKGLSENRIQLPSNFEEQEIVPQFSYNGSTREYDDYAYQLKNLEKLTNCSELVAERIPSLSSYYIDSDDRDVYEGSKEKTYWCFNINDAKKELANDILTETADLLMYQGTAKSVLEQALGSINKSIEDAIGKMIQTLIQAIDKI